MYSMDYFAKLCNPSSHTVSHVCLYESCDEKLLCHKCCLTHNGFHVAHIKPLNDIINFNSKAKVEEIKDIIGVSSRSHEKIHENFNSVTEKVKKEINDLIDKIFVLPNKKEIKERAKPSIGLEKLSLKLEELKEKFVGLKRSKNAKTGEVLKDYISVYNDFHKNINDAIQYSHENRINSLTYKDLELQQNFLLESIEQALRCFHTAYFNSQKAEKPELEMIAVEKELDSHWDITKFKKDNSIELSGPLSWNSIEYLADCNVLVTGDTTGNIKLWDSSTWECIATQSYHSSAINKIKYRQKNNCIFTASDDTTIKISKINGFPNIEPLATLGEHKDKVWSLLIIEDHDILYSSGSEPCIIGWDLNTLIVKHKLNTHGRGMTGTEMTFISRLNLLAVSFKDGVINMYNIETPSGEVRSIKVLQKWLHCMSYIESRDELVVGTDVGTIKVWKVGDYAFEPVRQYKIPGELPTSMTVVNDGNDMLVASGDHRIISLNLETGVHKTTENIECDKLKYMKVVSQIRRIFLGSDNTKLSVLKY